MKLLFHATHFIYKTTNLINGKIYVGQKKFINGWKTYLGSGDLLKIAIKKYGRDNFKRDIIEYCTLDTINEREIYWIAFLDSTNPLIGYNINTGGNGGREGTIMTEEQKQKIRVANKGRKLSYNQIQKLKKRTGINHNCFGVPQTDEHKQNISIALRGKPKTEEHRINMGLSKKGKPSPNKGKPMSEEQKEKISLANKGKTSSNKGKKLKPLTQQHKQNISKATKGRISPNKGKPSPNKGKPMSEEQKKKISIANKGKKHGTIKGKGKANHRKGKANSEEHNKRISESNKGRISPNKGKPMSEEQKEKLRKTYKITSPEGIETIIIGGIKKFIKDNNIGRGIERKINTGKIHQSWKIDIIPKE